jgi:hypothetical protein
MLQLRVARKPATDLGVKSKAVVQPAREVAVKNCNHMPEENHVRLLGIGEQDGNF